MLRQLLDQIYVHIHSQAAATKLTVLIKILGETVIFKLLIDIFVFAVS